MLELQQGGNAALADDHATIAFSWSIQAGRDVDADVSAYLLTASGKVRGDTDMVFYNQPEAVRRYADTSASTSRPPWMPQEKAIVAWSSARAALPPCCNSNMCRVPGVNSTGLSRSRPSCRETSGPWFARPAPSCPNRPRRVLTSP
ncbi:MAG: hypothetical protein EOP89_09690 [Lysobacteraceae bacterium]|nr:MAG: hypothetical protein EOP89_09690 [Xanthomonadaceae bacterium]